MRRQRKPRTFAVFFGATCMIMMTFGVLATPSRAEDNDPSERSRRSSSSTLIGAPLAVACSQAAQQGRFDDDALSRCDRALENERLDRPARLATHINRGTIHLRRSEPEAALADFNEAQLRDPKNADIAINRGAALSLLDRKGEAVVAFTEALQNGPTEPHKAYYNRGAARESLGDVRGALEDYETALAIKPDWGPAEAEVARFVRGRRDALAQRLSDPANSEATP